MLDEGEIFDTYPSTSVDGFPEEKSTKSRKGSEILSHLLFLTLNPAGGNWQTVGRALQKPFAVRTGFGIDRDRPEGEAEEGDG